MILKKGKKWIVVSKKGKKIGSYSSKKEAIDRLKQIEIFKHVSN